MRKPRKLNDVITQEELKKYFTYDEKTGKFYHKTNYGKGRIGQEAGTINKKGYLIIGFGNQSYRAHKLAWLYVYGYLPELQIDHIDRNKLNNAISNLREVTNTENHHNMGVQSNNKSGCSGVIFNKQNKKWRSYIKCDKKQIELGSFDTYENAIRARHLAEYILGFHNPKNEFISKYNVGSSDYSKHLIQPYQIWIEYKLNPFDADIVKRVLRHKKTDSRKMDYEKIIHICKERIRQIDSGCDVWAEKEE